MLKIKIIGKEGNNWSVDKDRYYTEKALSELNFIVTKSVFKANIIFSVWYSYLLRPKMFYLKLFKNKKIIAVITNNIEKSDINFSNYKKIVDYWIYSNSEQKKYLKHNDINEKQIFYNPYYVDETVFKKTDIKKKDIAKQLNIDFNIIKNKFLIGSFQRDSLGSNLTKPKWQKNPELLIEILKKIDRKKYILILAGPRRHFIINECKKHRIPYLFTGNENSIINNKDDISINNLSFKKINLLYNLIDLYLVTSVSEGGPKAIIEASLTKTGILSTPVGFASDLLNKHSICKDKNDFFKQIENIISNRDSINDLILQNYEKISKINNFEAYMYRLKNIIETVSNDR